MTTTMQKRSVQVKHRAMLKQASQPYSKMNRRFSVNVRAELYNAIKTDSIEQGETMREYVIRAIALRRPSVCDEVNPQVDYH